LQWQGAQGALLPPCREPAFREGAGCQVPGAEGHRPPARAAAGIRDQGLAVAIHRQGRQGRIGQDRAGMKFAGTTALWTLALAFVLPSTALARHRGNPDALAPVRVQDLAYGDVLFHYWADEDSGLEALTRLEAYEHWGLMPHHAADADLLAAGLYLQLGVHNEAGARFAKLLNARVPLAVRNRAWFYLGRIWYERGYYDKAEQALGRIQGQLTPELEGERNNLLVNALMYQGRYDAAIARLTGWRGPRDWKAFAQFNLGVALVRANRLAQAAPILTAVGTAPRKSKHDTEELASLRD